MTNTEILTKAIRKAINNGFVFGTEPFIKEEIKYKTYYYVIFSHDFAKAFWYHKHDSLCKKFKFCGEEDNWKHNLMAMVLFENPIKYLKSFLE